MYRLLVLAVLAVVVSGGSIIRSPWTPEGRIIGGEDVDIEDVPYQVSLRVYGSHSCGGSVITKDFIVTAGHCAGYSPSSYKVYVGSSNRNSNGRLHKVTKVVRHPGYGFNSRGIPHNDIAVMRVEPPFEFDDKCQPIDLYDDQRAIEEGTETVITGWGSTGASILPSTLKLVRVPYVTKEYCDEAYYKLGGLPEKQICAGYPEGGKDACQGDSGGPLAIKGQLAGITSWGNGCALPEQPGVYTEVAAYIDWIKENTSA